MCVCVCFGLVLGHFWPTFFGEPGVSVFVECVVGRVAVRFESPGKLTYCMDKIAWDQGLSLSLMLELPWGFPTCLYSLFFFSTLVNLFLTFSGLHCVLGIKSADELQNPTQHMPAVQRHCAHAAVLLRFF